MLVAFQKHIQKKFPFLKESKLLIAISGGLDSVALTHLCHLSKLQIALAHCNFNLREEESDGDEAFVLELAEQLDLEAFIQHFDTKVYAEQQTISIQMAARELRYDWLKDLANSLNYDYILTAHHADDNLETFLINLSRGSGLTGLIGIPECNDAIVRPLLPFSRQKLQDYMTSNQLKWRDDSSNAETYYLRNKLRHRIIPELKEISPELLSNFNQTISNLKDTADIVEESLNAVAKRAITSIDDDHIKFKVSEFKKVNNPKAYLFEMFKAYGFSEWDDVTNLLEAQSGKQVLSNTHRLLKDRTHLILTSRDLETNQKLEDSIVIKAIGQEIDTPFGIISIEKVNAIEDTSKQHIFVDADKLKFPLELRKWKKGDVFYPFGMTGKKKLSKYFKDEKMSLLEKEQVWLLTSEGQIIWVVNKRADNRFKVSKSTQDILKVSVI